MNRRIKTNIILATFLSLFIVTYVLSCKHENNTLINNHRYSVPQYDKISLHTTTDTIKFPLDSNTYNSIRCFNYFIDNGVEYISFYDKRSCTVMIYNFQSKLPIKKLSLRQLFNKTGLNNTSAFVKNLDTIFVCNQSSLHVFDTSGEIKNLIDFQTKPFDARALFETYAPPVFDGNLMYMKARCYLDVTSKRDLNKWKTIYVFNLKSAKSNISYQLPNTYRKNIYGNIFFIHSYCYNDQNKFVFSFPADTNIYETDLATYNTSFNGKSKFQVSDILPVQKKNLIEVEDENREYLLRHFYEAIYFDPTTKRYLRVSKSKISETDYKKDNWKRNQSIIIFNSNLEIIGESVVDRDLYLNSIFFTNKGDIYARTLVKNEYALYFVRLAYTEAKNKNDKVVLSSLKKQLGNAKK